MVPKKYENVMINPKGALHLNNIKETDGASLVLLSVFLYCKIAFPF